jgi:hypothetical protein
MKQRLFFRAVGAACALSFSLVAPLIARAAETKWHIAGRLSEACSCSVPCSCNFGQSPSPHPFCYAIVGSTIEKGNYGAVKLDGLKFGGANGAKGFVFYIDPRADKEQAAALRAIGTAMWTKALKANGLTDPKKVPPEMALRGFKTARIEHTSGDKSNHVLIENAARFDAAYLVGADGKTPIRLQNNWSFNITDNIKAKTSVFRYHDAFGNKFDMKNTNSNEGAFDWTEATPFYFR